MGSRDFRRRESKKTKRDTKKISIETILPAHPVVEVIKKRKSKREEEEPER